MLRTLLLPLLRLRLTSDTYRCLIHLGRYVKLQASTQSIFTTVFPRYAFGQTFLY